VKEGVDSHKTYFPGHDVVDILATDVYTQGFDSLNYAQLLDLERNFYELFLQIFII
jgi:mannan endo-1,4-beta-mannosidase